MNEWFKKHSDTLSIITSVILSVLWMNSQFNAINNRFNELEKEITIVKTVLIMKNIMPVELAKCEHKNEKE